jgi:hypothetical protein
MNDLKLVLKSDMLKSTLYYDEDTSTFICHTSLLLEIFDKFIVDKPNVPNILFLLSVGTKYKVPHVSIEVRDYRVGERIGSVSDCYLAKKAIIEEIRKKLKDKDCWLVIQELSTSLFDITVNCVSVYPLIDLEAFFCLDKHFYENRRLSNLMGENWDYEKHHY